MTNKEYIEKNNISFSVAMKMWDNQTNHIEDWLNRKHTDWKFKIGDVVAFKGSDELEDDYMSFVNRYVYFVVDSDCNYLYIKKFNRNGDIVPWSGYCSPYRKYPDDHSIWALSWIEQDNFKKIF